MECLMYKFRVRDIVDRFAEEGVKVSQAVVYNLLTKALCANCEHPCVAHALHTRVCQVS